jgi:hypothetical protein
MASIGLCMIVKNEARIIRRCLENALRTETDPFLISRYTFYLAQSYRDCGEKRQALQAYSRRSQLGYLQKTTSRTHPRYIGAV